MTKTRNKVRAIEKKNMAAEKKEENKTQLYAKLDLIARHTLAQVENDIDLLEKDEIYFLCFEDRETLQKHAEQKELKLPVEIWTITKFNKEFQHPIFDEIRNKLWNEKEKSRGGVLILTCYHWPDWDPDKQRGTATVRCNYFIRK
jgi:hypothetical protein